MSGDFSGAGNFLGEIDPEAVVILDGNQIAGSCQRIGRRQIKICQVADLTIEVRLKSFGDLSETIATICHIGERAFTIYRDRPLVALTDSAKEPGADLGVVVAIGIVIKTADEVASRATQHVRHDLKAILVVAAITRP